jgi:biopolymer transport protein ExbD
MHKTRRFVIKPAAQPNSEINVTPLVDVVLVLLIIFMVVTPLLEKEIDVRVPTTEKVAEPSEVPPDQLVVRVTKDGELSINDDSVPAADYVTTLRQKLEKRRSGDRVVFVVADDEARYGVLVSALDGARVAGAETLGMMTQPPETAAEPAPTPSGN